MSGCGPVGEQAVEIEVEAEKPIPQVAAEEAPLAAEQVLEPEVEPEEEAPGLVLKFKPGDVTTYKMINESQQKVEWQGPLPEDTDFKGGRNHNRLEMTFTQKVQSVDDKDNAVVEIIIGGVKYYSLLKDKVVLDFDNVTAEDQEHPLAMIVGKSYTIEIAPTGEVTRVIDVNEARLAARRGSVVPRRALALLRNDAIQRRHTVRALPAVDKGEIAVGDRWSNKKDFSFGLMGPKSYERIYTVKEIEDTDGARIAAVYMEAIPSSEAAEDPDQEQANAFSEMFDNKESYGGRLEFDLTAGKIRKYSEDLTSEWVAVEQKGGAEPTALKMTAVRHYSIEQID
jgi:hypothetical protein